MKNYEEIYKNAIERMKSWANGEHPECFSEAQKAAEFIFPELKESEDEIMKREIVAYINELADLKNEKIPTKWLAWLEKQSDKIVDCPQNHQDVKHPNGGIVMEDFNGGEGFYKLHLDYLNKKQVEDIEEMVRTWNKESKTSNENIKNCIGMCLTDANEQRFKNYGTTLKDCLDWLEKQGEQPTDKIEPKFKVGDWVILNGTVAQILDKQKYGFVGLDIDGKDFFCNHGHSDSMRLWTISDAEDGDILVASDESIFIYAGSTNRYAKFYVGLTKYGTFNFEGGNWDDKNSVHPSTKKQRDFLFQKMAKAGYEWDAENKKLKTIEQKHEDKVESKFKVGNWYQCTKDFFGKGVTFDKNTAYYCAEEGCLQDEYGCHIAIVKELYDNFKLWTIQDAKDGDVLVTEDYIFIFKYILHGGVRLYCHYNFDDEEFYVDIPDAVIGNIHDKGIHFRPATKEQRDLLFRKMKKEGYEWNIEQKSTDNVEPKFKVGDWIVTPENKVLQITSIEGTSYRFNNESHYWEICYCDEKCHLWTIEDAKDGDILATLAGAFIYNDKNGGDSRPGYYCGINTYGTFQISSGNKWTNKEVYPATKEQRDLLFAKMHDAGYAWDSEKKELNRIEPKTLNADKVIAWLDEHVPTKFEDMKNYVNQFKKDFEL